MLGKFYEAYEEFNKISKTYMFDPEVIITGWALCHETGNQRGREVMARAFVEAHPNSPDGYILTADTVIASDGHDAAYQQIAPIGERFPESHKLNHKVAVCACQSGRVEESLHWLERAFEAARATEMYTWKELVWNDPELAPAIELFKTKYMVNKQD